MTKLSLIVAGIAGGAMVALTLGAAAAQAHEDGSLPAPAYAYAGTDGGYADEGPDCGRDQFTILGAHAGATVLGFNAGVGGHFGFGDGCHRRHHHAWRQEAGQGYGPPRGPDPYPAAYPQAPWGAPYAYRAYAPPPPPPSRPMGGPCGCDPRRGW